jgi:hypothetical protein
MISCRDWWSWTKPGYVTMTRSKVTINAVTVLRLTPTLLKNSEWKIWLDKLSPKFFGIKTASSSLFTLQKAKPLTRSVTHLCWCNWRTFWREKGSGSSPRWSSLTTIYRLTGHLQPRINWPVLSSHILNTYPILRIWPLRATTSSVDWRTVI